MKKIIATAEAPAALGPYSQAVAQDGWLFCSGQIPLKPGSGTLLEGDVSVQTTQVLENLGAVLRANGMNFEDVLKTTVFLTDMDDFQPMNQVYGDYFKATHPARSTVAVASLPKGARVEIEAVAFAAAGK